MNAGAEPWLEFFRMLRTQLPELIVTFLGMVLALAFWPRHSRASLLAFLGFLVLFMVVIGTEVWYAWGMDLFVFPPAPPAVAPGPGPNEFNQFDYFMLIRSGVNSVGYLLLIFAVLAGRRTYYRPPQVQE
ncbi:MAG: hypothetical protein L0Y72_31715 [Gemmataceae bacterium]|nr:hypothetical protein [Gemmataceae bacterium]MCI0743621.1 hypothetical protein [Gemmataceae bacterium]